MKKILKILLIIILASSLITTTAFFILDYSKIKEDINKYILSPKFHSLKSRYLGFSETFDKDYYDFEQYITDKTDEYTDDLIYNSFGNNISQFITKSIMDNISLSTDNFGLLPSNIIDKHKHLIDTQNLDDFDILQLNVLNLAVKIQQGSENKIEFYSDKKDTDINKYITLSQKKSMYTVDQINDNRSIYMVISLSTPEKVDVAVNSENILFLSENSFKSLNVSGDNALINLKGTTSYDMNIDLSNSYIGIDLNEYDAKINLSMSSGIADILGENYVFADYKDINKNIENGKDKINITTSNSIVKIK